MSTDTRERLKKPARTEPAPWWPAIATAAVVIAVVLAAVLLAPGGGSEPVSPSTTVVEIAPEVEVVIDALAVFNTGDIEAWVAFWDPDAPAIQPGRGGFHYEEILFNANRRVELTGACATVASDRIRVQCPTFVDDDYLGPAGLLGEATSVFTLDEELRIVHWDWGFECCPEWNFNRDFYTWIFESYPEVYPQVGASRVDNLPGNEIDPARMGVAIQYVDEFIAQSDDWPAGSDNPEAADPAAAAIDDAIRAINAGDFDAWLADWDPTRAAACRDGGCILIEMILGSSPSIELTGSCTPARSDPLSFECPVVYEDGIWSKAGLTYGDTASIRFDDQLRVVDFDRPDFAVSDQEWFGFNRDFSEWLEAAHPEVGVGGTVEGNSLSKAGFDGDASALAAAVALVNDFIAQTENFPLASRPQLVFTGQECLYTGALGFRLGADQRFRWQNDSLGPVTLTFWDVPDGTTVDDVVAAGGIAVLADASPGTEPIFTFEAPAGDRGVRRLVLDRPGTWLVNCLQEGAGTVDAPATVFAVSST